MKSQMLKAMTLSLAVGFTGAVHAQSGLTEAQMEEMPNQLGNAFCMTLSDSIKGMDQIMESSGTNQLEEVVYRSKQLYDKTEAGTDMFTLSTRVLTLSYALVELGEGRDEGLKKVRQVCTTDSQMFGQMIMKLFLNKIENS